MEVYLSLKDHVYNYIAEEINKGNLKPEEKINEQKISDLLNISRTPVREALIQLASEGFLENVPRKGFLIRPLSEKEAGEIYLILGVLDGLAVSLACPRITEKEIRDMQFYIGSMSLAIDSGNFDMYYRQQEEFHQIYLNLCGNESLINLMNRTKKKFLKKSYIMDVGDAADDNVKEVLRSTNDEHRTMLTLFEQKNALELERFMKEVHWKPDLAYMETI
ncbi:GntR family transcriptional regulator [Anaerovorax sp. IOR16]|uniref:GntR family transcriptional regulator n=1 Tax=Anaerovorax sp. IOR16 TaxID=2773458 RepID=UPI0019CF5D80|nr:GntR family transcriptional regulator [Anaerovorax sp. IOR16]